MINFYKKNNKGIILSSVFVFAIIATTLIIALTSWFGVTVKSIRTLVEKEQTFHIAEAGVEYYRWHLSHNPEDLQDGTGSPGPYVHDFYDREGNLIGNFSLEIEYDAGIVIVESTGNVISNPELSRTIRVRFSRPSVIEYAFLSDSDTTFRNNTEVFGKVHSNGGIRFDGYAHNLFSSAKAQYDDPTHTGPQEFGVHTHLDPIDPLPPNDVPERLDVFSAGREFPVETVDFQGIVADLAQIQEDTQGGEGMYFPHSGDLGYVVVLKIDDTFDLYKVKQLENSPGSCVNKIDQEDWGTWSYKDNDLGQGANFVDNYPIPDGETLFFEDHVWVQGQIDGMNITIAAASFPDIPSDRKNIIINNNLLYSNYDGTDTIALLAQNNINIGLLSENELRIDGALIAQNGRVGRYYYNKPGGGQACATEKERDNLTLYGTVISKEQFGFSYSDGTGYNFKEINYDPNLSFNLPPSIPLTSGQYEPISWEEITNK